MVSLYQIFVYSYVYIIYGGCRAAESCERYIFIILSIFEHRKMVLFSNTEVSNLGK